MVLTIIFAVIVAGFLIWGIAWSVSQKPKTTPSGGSSSGGGSYSHHVGNSDEHPDPDHPQEAIHEL